MLINTIDLDYYNFEFVVSLKLVLILKVSRGTIGSFSSAYVVIEANDDPCGKFIFDPPIIKAIEDSKTATAKIKRLGGSAGDVRVYYETMITTTANSTNFKGFVIQFASSF